MCKRKKERKEEREREGERERERERESTVRKERMEGDALFFIGAKEKDAWSVGEERSGVDVRQRRR